MLSALGGVVALDRFRLDDHGRVTALDAAGGGGDGSCKVACGHENRQPDRQRRQQGQYDLLDVLFHRTVMRIKNYELRICEQGFLGQQLVLLR